MLKEGLSRIMENFPIMILAAIVGGIVLGIPAFFLGVSYRRRKAEAEIGSATEEANRIKNEAYRDAQNATKEAKLEAKEEIYHLRAEAEEDIKSRRAEVQKQQDRITLKEENLDKKVELTEEKDEKLNQKIKEAEDKMLEVESVRKQEQEMLEKISGMTADQAKVLLLEDLEGELNHEKAVRILEYEQSYKDTVDEKARNIISMAIQRCAPEQVSEATISVVALPNDEMKGRIIGREGRNIRSIETLTGVDLIIDDTPEAITLSSFDPVRRAVAKATLEKLVEDGRIHPTRIEEMYEKSKREIEQKIKDTGNQTVMELGLRGVNPELVKLIGRLQYRTSYGQNMLNHSKEVAYLAGMMAAEVGSDVTLARRAGLLHDIGKVLDHEYEGTHVQIGVEVCRKYKESPEVIHAVEAHHNDVEPETITACLVQAADAISAARPAARRENLQNYIKRLENLEEIAGSFEGVEKVYAVQAGRELRIMVSPNVVSDDAMVLLARDIAKKIEEEMQYPGQIKVNIIRESRASEYAK